MGRAYAGVLGLTAFTTLVVRAIGQQSSASATFPVAAAMLFVFAGIGYVVGSIAERAIANDLKVRFAEEMSRLQANAAQDKPK